MRTRGPGTSLLFLLTIASCSAGMDAGDPPDSAPRPDTAAAADAPAYADAAQAADATLSADEPPSLTGITAAHNAIRGAHGVAPIVWDAQLAAIAQAWTDRCVDTAAPTGLIDLNPDATTSYGSYVGQNVYGNSGTTTGQDAVNAWASEESNYNYANNTCSGSCGSYTQIVWANSTKLGCGFTQCPSMTYGYSIVCHYAPGGNDGNRPY